MQHDNIVYSVDPDDAIGEALTALLGTYDIRVRSFSDAESFLRAYPAEEVAHGCLLVEANLPGLSGLSLLRQLRAQGFSSPVIVLTNTASREIRRQALQLGATDVLEKPLINAFLGERLSQLLSGASNLNGTAPSGIELRDGTRVTFRVMRPEDADIEQAFVRGLSARSRYQRFFSSIRQLSPRMLEQFIHPNYPDSYALIATVVEGERERQIGVARYTPTEDDGVVEFAVVVADAWQGLGVATHLLHGITTAAAVAGIKRLEGLVLRENHRMLALVKELGFTTSHGEDDPTIVVRLIKELDKPVPPFNSQQLPGKPKGKPTGGSPC